MDKMIKNIFLSIFLLFFLGEKSFGQTPVILPVPYNNVPVSYVRTWEPVKPYNSEIEVMSGSRVTKEVRQTTQYFDGLGRPLQTVIKNGSIETNNGVQRDFVVPILYDEFGRERLKYLPYASVTASDGNFKTSVFSEQAAFYENQLNGQPNETNVGGTGRNWAYSKANFEASPLNRVTETYAPGASWVGSETSSSPHPVKMKYWFNTTTDAVRIWTVNEGSSGGFGTYTTGATTIDADGIYNAGELYKNVTEDEHGKQVIEFKDKDGRIILKKVQLTATAETNGSGSDYTGWICTYYIYDDLNNLRAVVQPEGVKALIGNGWSFNSTILDEQIFRYEYDHRNRMIMKKVPGAGEVYMVYDNWDRLLLTQDANMRANGQYLFTKYDALNRPVITGIYYNYATIQDVRTIAATYAPYRFEDRASSGEGYTSRCWPEYNYDVLTVTYYDDYNWYGNVFTVNRNTDFDNVFLSPSDENYPYPQPLIQSFATKGMVTGTKVKILGSSQFLYTINTYDDKGRLIQVRNKNITGWVDVISTQYDYSGKPLIKYEVLPKNFATSQTDYVLTKYNYDQLGRIADIKKTVGSHIGGNTWIGSSEVQVVRNEYDKLGQLKKKEIGKQRNQSVPSQYTSSPIETLNYDYNIRGWMLGMNRDYTRDVNNTNYFGFDLGYDKMANGLIGNASYAKAQYNGNIGGMVWKSKGDSEKRRYDFDYDPVNRLLRADFTQFTNGSFNQDALMNFNVKMGDGNNITTAYDDNGNIKRMQQWGWKLNGSVQIDDLRYTYEAGTNKLRNVIDFNGQDDTKLGDFRTSMYHPQKTNKSNYVGSGTGNVYDIIDYTYDANGNLKKDLNKDMGNGANEGIVYNHLNLPSVITMRKPDGTIKGTITYTYDAAGTKHKKVVDEYPSALNGNISTVTITHYIGGFVYESKVDTDVNTTDYNNKLLFGGHEEGRVRALYDNVNSPLTLTGFAYDYMLKDHLGNVRMVLTDEVKPASVYQATIETSNRANEIQLFTKIPETENAKPGNDLFDTDGNNQTVSKLFNSSGSDKRVGPGVVLKVMAGDKFKARTFGWYLPNGTNFDPLSGATSIVSSLVAAFSGGIPAGAAHSGTQLSSSGILDLSMGSFLTNQNNQTVGNRPRAYLNWMILDEEQFKLIDGNYGVEQIPEITGTMGKQLMQANSGNDIEVKKNGYLYVYVSNESQGSVYFDDIRIEHIKGSLIEETHYYPFGLTMAGISSKAANTLQNKEKTFQGQRFDDEIGLNWSQFKWRNHDVQIGRFVEIDPLSEKYVNNSTYAFSENKVTAHVELEGLESQPINYDRPNLQNAPILIRVVTKDNVQKPLQRLVNNWAEVGEVKAGVCLGCVGTTVKVGKVGVQVVAGGPSAEVGATTGGKKSANASLAGAGVKIETPAGEAQAGGNLGVVQFKDGKVTTSVYTGGADVEPALSVEKSRAGGAVNTGGTINSSGAELSFGLKLGLFSIKANLNVVKTFMAAYDFIDATINMTKASIREASQIPTFGQQSNE